MARLKVEKIVWLEGMMPVISSKGWPGVATESGIEPASPPCQTRKPE